MPIAQNILVTVDAVIFGLDDTVKTHLLLIKRKHEPFKDKWALPGGFVENDEDLPQACVRELEEETGLQLTVKQLTQLGAFAKPGRDPRGRTLTVAFSTTVDMDSQNIKAADDAAEAKWWSLAALPEMAFDHSKILDQAMSI